MTSGHFLFVFPPDCCFVYSVVFCNWRDVGVFSLEAIRVIAPVFSSQAISWPASAWHVDVLVFLLAAAMRTSSEIRLAQRLDVLCCVVRLTQEKHFFWEVCLVRLEGITSVWWTAQFHLSLPHPVKWNCDSGRCNVLYENSFWFRLSFLNSVSCVEQFSL